jgi:FtsZ family, C-terminal domain
VPSKHHAHRLARVPVVRKASGVFVIITGGADLSIRELDEVGRLLTRATNQRATVIIAAPVTYEDKGCVTVSLLVGSRRCGRQWLAVDVCECSWTKAIMVSPCLACICELEAQVTVQDSKAGTAPYAMHVAVASIHP